MIMDPNLPAYPQFPNDRWGMTVRAEFAKAAMQGILANNPTPVDRIAHNALLQADQLIEQLNKDTDKCETCDGSGQVDELIDQINEYGGPTFKAPCPDCHESIDPNAMFNIPGKGIEELIDRVSELATKAASEAFLVGKKEGQEEAFDATILAAEEYHLNETVIFLRQLKGNMCKDA